MIEGRLEIENFFWLENEVDDRDLDDGENLDCDAFAAKKNRATKYKAEINYRIAFITKGYSLSRHQGHF